MQRAQLKRALSSSREDRERLDGAMEHYEATAVFRELIHKEIAELDKPLL